MPSKTPISWTDYTWNIARGCTKVSDGCKFCYMMREGDRYKYDGKVVKKTGKSTFNKPNTISGESGVWDGPPLIFTSSLTDFFHEDIDAFRDEAWAIIRNNPDKIFQILTKRPERVYKLLPPDWGNGWKNVWMGVSIENQAIADERIQQLHFIPAYIRFISIEPLLGPVDISDQLWLNSIAKMYCRDCGDPAEKPCDNTHCQFKHIHWIIVGGESGNDNGPWKYRPCYYDWIHKIVSDCQANKVPVFVKQLGTHLGKELKITRHGKDIEQFPQSLQIRQFPTI